MGMTFSRGFVIRLPIDAAKSWTKREAKRFFPQASGIHISDFGRQLSLYYYRSRSTAAMRESAFYVVGKWRLAPLAKSGRMTKQTVYVGDSAVGVLTKDESGAFHLAPTAFAHA